jgi:hypothetical protein
MRALAKWPAYLTDGKTDAAASDDEVLNDDDE